MSKNFQAFKNKFSKVVVTSTAMIAMLGTVVVSAHTMGETTANLNMREGSNTSTKVIQVIQKGEKVEVIKKDGKWSQVKYNGKTGYVYNRYLAETTVKKGTVKVGDSRLNVRTKASMSGKIIGKLYTGNKVEIKGEDGNWYKINYKGKTGYISKKYVKLSSTTITEVEACSDVFQAQIGFNVRTGPSTSYSQIGRLIKGQVFQVKGKCSNGWYQIQYGSKTGYVSDKYLDKMEEGSTDPQVVGTAKVDTKSTKDPYLSIRHGQGTDTEKLDEAKTGTELQILADKSPVKGWTKVRYNNLTGYAYTKWLVMGETPDTPDTDEAPVITCKDEIKMTVGDKLELTDLNLAVKDKEDGDLTDKAQIDTSKVDTSKIGEYEIKITVEDSKGNKAEKVVKVIVQQKDDSAPVIKSKDELTLTVGDKLSIKDLDLAVTDREDGDLTDKAEVDLSKVDTSKAGIYQITITVKDSFGNQTTKTVRVTVNEKGETPEENEAPTITADDLTLYTGDEFSKDMLNIKANDREDGDLTDKVEISGKVDTSKVGEYELTLTVKDSKGAKAEKKVTVTVKKKVVKPEVNEAPVINAKDITLNVGDKFNLADLQIKATDKEDGDLTDKVAVEGNVNTTKAGVYTITITVQDSKGAVATKKVTVTVKEKEVVNQKPTISADNVTITEGDSFDKSMLNIKANDAEDGDLADKVEISGEVNAMKAGTYTLTLTVKDSKGATATTKVTVTVKAKEVKNEAPVITANDVTIKCGDKLSKDMFNAKANDAEEGDITKDLTIDTSKVNTNKVGTYDVYLAVKDSKGAKAEKTVKVTVKSTNPTLKADNVKIEEGDTLKDTAFNIVARDCEGNSIKYKIDKSKVNTSKAGTYRVKITAEDKWGNTTSIDVKVEVTEKAKPVSKPVITSVDSITIEVGQSLELNKFKASAEDDEEGDLTDEIVLDKSGVNTSKPGTYKAYLSVTNSQGVKTTKEVTIIVKAVEVQGYDVNSPQCRAVIQQEMYRLVNAHRANNGRNAYKVSSLMQNTAWVKSKDMGENNYFDHQYNGKDIWEYKDCADSDNENIALCGYNAKGGKMTDEQCKDLANIIFNMWKESEGHNATMLSKAMKSIGFDLYMVDKGNGAYTVYATQEFRVTNE